MTAEETALAVVRALNACGVPYMLVGSFSSNFYGVARSTQDADFVVEFGDVSPRDIAEQLGRDFRLDPQLSFETVTGTTRAIIELVDTAFKIELFLLSDDPHDQERFRRRRCVKIGGCDCFLPTPEDIIITKLRWSRQGDRRKDVDDVKGVVAVQGERIDWEYVTRWCDEHGTRELLDEVRSSAPSL